MNLALTSDFPSTANQVVVDRMRSTGRCPRVAWIPPFTAMGRARFPAAQKLFESYGFSDVEYCDIDEEPNEGQLTCLDEYDVVYLTGGDPIGFRRNILRAGLSSRLQQCLVVGRLIVGASGGSMQLTRIVSLFRLLTHVARRGLRESWRVRGTRCCWLRVAAAPEQIRAAVSGDSSLLFRTSGS